ncbi:MAG: hypothetical protein HC934_01645 [Acaryochloridaceae cyanobacterium SU_2_1]|nr:hypothetical protein [Acaryochloridaceae cyanobacterium SU_2_1]
MNFGTPVPLIVGVVLIVGAISLFFLDKIKPGYQRDADIIYAFLCLLSGVMLLTDLTMGFALSLQQLMVVGMLVTLLFENVRNRVPGNRPTKPVNNRGRMRDEDYPPRRSRVSERAEAQLEREEEFFPVSRQSPRARRIRPEGQGGDLNSYRDNSYQDYDEYAEDSSRRRPSRRRPSPGDEDLSSQGSSPYNSSYQSDPAISSGYSANQANIEEQPRRRRPLQLKGEIEDKTYTPDDYSSAVKALRNRRRQQNGTDSSDRNEQGPGNGYGSNFKPDDYADYKPLDLPKPPGPRPNSGDRSGFDGEY